MNRWTALLFALVAVVYALVAAEAARCQYQLVNDYIAFSMIRIGAWPASIARSVVDLTSPGAWLYRPLPDFMAWLFATLFRSSPGAWHLVMIAVRLLSVALAFLIALECGGMPPLSKAAASCRTPKAAAATGAAYFAFFPAFPEIDLLRAENWLIPALAAAFLGYLRLKRGAGSVWGTTLAFVLATMSKEVAAPLTLALFVLLAPLLWKRGARVAVLAMGVALANQLARCVLMLGDPYARGSGANLLSNAFWTAKVLLLAATSFPLLSLLLAVLIVLGLVRMPRGAALLLLVAVALAVAAPYPAIRYAYPAALFLVPCIARGVEQLRGRVAQPLAAATIVLLAVYGGASLWAQAAAMRASSRADWKLLNQIADAYSSGHGIAIVDDADFERSFWMRAELAGVDPRWPYLSYVARRYALLQPVEWRYTGAVNLTGRVHRAAASRDVLLVPANPIVGEDRSAFTRFARMLNPRFHYAVDVGESPYPGHYWPPMRLISRAGLPPTSVNGGTSRVTTEPAATTQPRPK